jgi:hypothetical protein
MVSLRHFASFTQHSNSLSNIQTIKLLYNDAQTNPSSLPAFVYPFYEPVFCLPE